MTEAKENTFVLITGRKVQKEASYCVSAKIDNRWSNKFYKSREHADQEIQRLRDAGETVYPIRPLRRFDAV
jgi:hypothetical protein